MYPSPRYLVDPAEVEDFLATQRHGHLIATGPDSHPSVSILPYVKRGDHIELHCVQADPTFAAIQVNPRVTFFVADFLAFSRHDWVDPADAGRATLNFKAVELACEATTSTDPAEVAATLAGLLRAYEPDATYQPIADGEFYGERLRRLAVVHLWVVGVQAKWKVGPAAPDAIKRQVVAGLRERVEPGDARAAAVIEAALPAE